LDLKGVSIAMGEVEELPDGLANGNGHAEEAREDGSDEEMNGD